MDENWDVVVIGGGPGGATGAFYLAQAGLRTLILEKETFPRYAVGESLLPYILEIFREMDFIGTMERAGFMKKFGAIFGESKAESVTRIAFSDGLQPEYHYSYMVPRDEFDTLLLEHVKTRGVHHRHASVDSLIFDGERVVGVEVTETSGAKKRIGSKLVMDASGRAAFVGRKLRLMQPDPRLDTASVFALYDGITWPDYAEPGDPLVITFPLGWFWLIPFSDGRTSVGVVMDRTTYDDFPGGDVNAFFDEMVRQAGGRVEALVAQGRRIEELHVLRKFAKHATRLAGPGWVLVGDAAMFIDPVFAAGVYVAAHEARCAAKAAIPHLLAGTALGAEHFEAYSADVKTGYEVFARFIYSWQDPRFRKFFFGSGAKRARPLVQTITTILAGGVFDRELIARGEALFFKFAERDGSTAHHLETDVPAPR